MIVKKVLLLGGSGFLGTSIAEQLVRQDVFVTVVTRRCERAKHLLVLPTVDLVEADIHDNDRLQELVCGNDAGRRCRLEEVAPRDRVVVFSHFSCSHHTE